MEAIQIKCSEEVFQAEITCNTIHFHQLEANVGWRSVLNSSWTCAFAYTCTHAPVCFFSLDSLSWTCFTVGNADRCSFTASVIGEPMSSRAVAGAPLMETHLRCVTLRTLRFQRFTLLTHFPVCSPISLFLASSS